MGASLKATFNNFKRNVLGLGLYRQEDEARLYERKGPNFADTLPYTAYDEYTKTWILEDHESRAVVLTLKPISTVGKTTESLVQDRNYIRSIYETFERVLPEQGQWVLQEFYYNDNRVSQIMKSMRDYIAPHAKGTEFTEQYLKVQEHHLRGMNNENGIYKDRNVTREQWGLKVPRIKLVIYRRVTNSDLAQKAKGRFDAAQELNEKIEDLSTKFASGGLTFERDTKEDVLYWLFDMFNGDGDYEGEREDYIKKMTDVDDDVVTDLSDVIFVDRPVSNTKDNSWSFGNKKSRFLRFSGLTKKPRIGQISGEVAAGSSGIQNISCAIDAMPVSTMVTRTIVFTHKGDLEATLNTLETKSKGGSTEARKARRIHKQATEELINDDNAVRCTMGVYFSGNSVEELERQQRKIITTFANNNIALIKDTEDGLCLDSYLIHLPMNFKPLNDLKFRYLRQMRMDHNCNLSLLFGRSEGSGNPGLMFFNRGGTPVFHDPLNGDERAMNAFSFVVGPPGAGKSVTLAQMAIMNMAVHRPRLFIVEYGNSFGLLGEYFERFGLKVLRQKLDPQNAPSLAPFADIDLVIDQSTEQRIDSFDDWDLSSIKTEEGQDALSLMKKARDSREEAGDTEDEDRDVLGELELITFLMITGGEEREYLQYLRADRQLIREALVHTAYRMRDEGKKSFETALKANALTEEQIEAGPKPKSCITQDVIDTMIMMVNGKYDTEITTYTSGQKDKLNQMLTTLKMFTTGFNAKLFNRPGESFPDVDVVLIDLAELAKDANKDKLAVAYTALMQRVNYLAEKHQSDARQILVYTDECHLVCSNPLLGPFLVKMVKCFRKLQTWPLFATQNVGDMAGGSAKLLSMIEWYFALNTEKEEAELIQEVKGLPDEICYLLQSSRKQAKSYTEGVICSKNYNTQFRSSPASLFLAIAMTEGHEKSARREIMEEKGCDDLTAAYYIAQQIDKGRGFKHELAFN
ncbi:conjugative transfer ATPase [Vibrio sp. Y2-5]|uniref:conjugative transfer ATPase n=1 Tax=Vibrio sp. Y2-5 TaxID=2743977 RepID=UPI00166054B9|nr:conjugative transfer ATPase [Vibrio sp. Y2-5]MBD0788038.1 conjugative transfer ATPase [Vibrio sp. Y2-5]